MAKNSTSVNSPRMNRRQVLAALAAAGSVAAVPGAAQAAACRPRAVTWRNWSGAQTCMPEARVAPASEEALADLVRSARMLRPVGSGHSFSGLVPTDGTLVSLGRLHGLLGVDTATQQAEFGAGTLLSRTGAPLKEHGLALENMPDIDYQTFGGALATSTHGTGIGLGSMSTQVAGLRLVTANGDVLDCDAENNPAIFNAAKVSLGALGVISRYRVQCRDAFRLHERSWIAKTEDLLDDIDNLVANNQHWEMQVVTHSDYAMAVALNETDAPATTDGEEEDEGGNAYVALLQMMYKYGRDHPNARRRIMNLIASQIEFDDRVADSFSIFANVRNVRFNEMEYQVPAEDGPNCLREILAAIHKFNLPTWFPIEYRYVKGDDITLSQFQGRDSASISIHQYFELDYHEYFAAVEPIFWKYGGRPHWGKVHTLNARKLRDLYPHWDDFAAIREELDPQGKFLNGHLRSILGA